MTQTLFCLAAVLVFGTFAFTRHQTVAADERAEIVREIEAAALATAEDWAARAKDVAFDATGAFDGLDTVVTARAGRGLVALRVRATLTFADPATLAPVAGPSAAKRVEIVVTEETPGAHRAPVRVHLPVVLTLARQSVHA